MDMFDNAEVSEKEGMDYAENCGDVLFMQTSAAKGTCIEDFFVELGRRFYEKYKDGVFGGGNMGVDLKEGKKNGKDGKCC